MDVNPSDAVLSPEVFRAALSVVVDRILFGDDPFHHDPISMLSFFQKERARIEEHVSAGILDLLTQTRYCGSLPRLGQDIAQILEQFNSHLDIDRVYPDLIAGTLLPWEEGDTDDCVGFIHALTPHSDLWEKGMEVLCQTLEFNLECCLRELRRSLALDKELKAVLFQSHGPSTRLYVCDVYQKLELPQEEVFSERLRQAALAHIPLQAVCDVYFGQRKRPKLRDVLCRVDLVLRVRSRARVLLRQSLFFIEELKEYLESPEALQLYKPDDISLIKMIIF